MTTIKYNYNELERRGARIEEAEFVMLKCENCETYALYDEEIMTIYPDPHDLKISMLYGIKGDPTSVACPSCGALNSFDYITHVDLNAIRTGPWNYILI